MARETANSQATGAAICLSTAWRLDPSARRFVEEQERVEAFFTWEFWWCITLDVYIYIYIYNIYIYIYI